MSLPIPILDDKTFDVLVEEARKLIPVYAPRWTDHNLSDPGITLIDLFAWLVEMELYSLDVVDDRHLLKYLSLLDFKPRPASPARVDLQLEPVSNECVTVPAGTGFKTSLPGSSLVFESEETVEVLPLELKKVFSYFDYRFTDVTEFNRYSRNYYHAFGKNPEVGDALYFGFSTGALGGALAGKTVRFAIYPYDVDLPPVGEGLPGEEQEMEVLPPSVEVNWECWNAGAWVTLAVTADEDAVPLLICKGVMALDFPGDFVISESGLPDFPDYINVGDEAILWVRCRLSGGDYEIPPRLDRVLPNVVSAVEGETTEETWESTGLPFQEFKTRRYPVVPGSVTVEVNGEIWDIVDDFDASGPGDPHVITRPAGGDIYFGDGLNGAVPPAGEQVTVHYRISGGIKGNVGAGTITGAGVTGIEVIHPFAADGGREEETIKETFVRVQEDLAIPYTAVTAEDYEYLAGIVPGLRVARTRAVLIGANRVTVVVMPYSFEEKPLAGESFKRAVCRYLEQHRLLTTFITVSDPDYVKVSVSAEIRIKEGYGSEQMKERITGALDCFLSPLKRESGDNEWPFGRPVYSSEINEVLEDVEGVDCVTTLSLSASLGSFQKVEGNIEIGPLSVVYPGTHQIDIITPHMKCKKKAV
jgi:predicted phage baseplate assembly protein